MSDGQVSDGPSQVTPGMLVQPGPLISSVHKMPDGTIVLRIEHSTGMSMFPMPEDFAKRLITQLQQATSGIVVVQTLTPGAN